ncbi:hypothetical protein B0H11DRAFT_2234230 [Mycena galericulata]|nr:hypothetical protein B0H11DRAFT_2234230 [Mycena galericulata]
MSHTPLLNSLYDMGRRSPFSDAQNAHIATLYPALLAASEDDLKTLKDNTVQSILDSPLFKGKLASKEQDPKNGGSPKEWKERLLKKLTNYVDRHSQKSADSRKSVDSTLTDSKASLAPATNGLDLKGFKGIWDAEDPKPDPYPNKSHKPIPDIAFYQGDFVRAMTQALTDVCRGGELGEPEFMLFYAFRESNGTLRAGTIDAHFSDDVADMAGETPDWQTNFQAPWRTFAERVIPYAADLGGIVIPRNSEGIAIFPRFDLKMVTATEISETLTKYLGHLWARSWGTNIPAWASIATEPHVYYDTDKYHLPVNLQNPEALGSIEVHMLAGFFATVSEPFVFRSQAETVQMRSAANAAVHQGFHTPQHDGDAGDEGPKGKRSGPEVDPEMDDAESQQTRRKRVKIEIVGTLTVYNQ